MTISKTLFLIFVALLLLHECKPWRRRRRRRAPPPCRPRDCTVTSWTGWNACTHQCGSSGTQVRTRTRASSEYCGGRCPYHFSETRACNRHCQNGGTPQNGYCSCRPAFTGTCCQQDVDECTTTRPCQHICTNTPGSYICECHSCYTKVGTRCELRQCKIDNKCFASGAVNPNNTCQVCNPANSVNGWSEKPGDGKWSAWGEWDVCSKTCEGGTQKRHRTCSSPPSECGKSCSGHGEETRSCNLFSCPIDCTRLPTGIYPHYSNCSKYIMCLATDKVVKCCPAGKYYNRTTRQCDFKENVRCDNSEVSTTKRFVPIGCFADKPKSRAFDKIVANLRQDIDWHKLNLTINACAEKVQEMCGWSYFGVQFYGECWSSPGDGEAFKRHGVSTECSHGVGRGFTNYVYKLIE